MGLLSRIGSAIGGVAKKVVSTAKNVVSKATTAVKSTATKAATAVKSAVSKPSSSSSSSSSKSSGGGSSTLSKIANVVLAPTLLAGTQIAKAVPAVDTAIDLATGKTPMTNKEGEEVDLRMGTVPLGPLSGVKTAVSTAAQVGKPAISEFPALGMKVATNAKTLTTTGTILKAIGGSAAVVGIIGTYPFSGFIKEEALQTLGFAVNAAREAGDVDGERQALDEIAEILDPKAWEQIVSLVPFANVVKELKDFYSAATTKLQIDEQSLALRAAEEDKWSLINAENEQKQIDEDARVADEKAYWEEQQRQDDIRVQEERDYWADQQATQDDKDQAERDYFANLEVQRQQTKLDERAADEVYYANIEAEKKIQELKDRGDDEAYYAAIAMMNRRTKLEEREADSAYYEGVEQANRQTKVDDARLWDEYYKAVADKDDVRKAEILKKLETNTTTATPAAQPTQQVAQPTTQPQQQTKAGPSPQGFTGTQAQPQQQGAGPSPQGFTGTTPYKSNYKSVIGYQAPKPQAPQAPPVPISNYERAGSTVSKPGQAQWVDPNPKPAAPKKPRVATTTSTATSSYKSPTYKPIIRQPDVVTQKMNKQINTGQYTTKPTSVSIGKMKEPIKLNTIKTQAPAKQYQTFTQMKGSNLTSYEKTAIDNWNSGKSSLSFAWLKGGEWY